MPRWKLFGAIAALVLVGVGIFCLTPGRVDITYRNSEQIRRGMSRAEIQAIIGCPPGDYSTGPTTPVPQGLFLDRAADEEPFFVTHPLRATDLTERWQDDGARLTVSFDQSGHALEAHYECLGGIKLRPLDNLLWRAKRQWRRWFPD
jgi:hypothetical protein